MPQLALAWLLQKKEVASVLVGARSPEELRVSVEDAADLEVPADVLDRATAARSAAMRAKLGDNADMWMAAGVALRLRSCH